MKLKSVHEVLDKKPYKVVDGLVDPLLVLNVKGKVVNPIFNVVWVRFNAVIWAEFWKWK